MILLIINLYLFYQKDCMISILNSQNISVVDTVGTVTSPLFGPAKSWNKVTWNGGAQNNNNIQVSTY